MEISIYVIHMKAELSKEMGNRSITQSFCLQLMWILWVSREICSFFHVSKLLHNGATLFCTSSFAGTENKTPCKAKKALDAKDPSSLPLSLSCQHTSAYPLFARPTPEHLLPASPPPFFSSPLLCGPHKLLKGRELVLHQHTASSFCASSSHPQQWGACRFALWHVCNPQSPPQTQIRSCRCTLTGLTLRTGLT